MYLELEDLAQWRSRKLGGNFNIAYNVEGPVSMGEGVGSVGFANTGLCTLHNTVYLEAKEKPGLGRPAALVSLLVTERQPPLPSRSAGPWS